MPVAESADGNVRIVYMQCFFQLLNYNVDEALWHYDYLYDFPAFQVDLSLFIVQCGFFYCLVIRILGNLYFVF